jgi:uncharacterized protein
MINNFPKFGQLELSDKNEILAFAKDFLHYSDFNFSNLWSWDIALSKRGFSRLNGNLIIKMFDFKNNRQFFSICGSKLPNETVKALFSAKRPEESNYLIKYLPEALAKKISLPSVAVAEDRDSFDYIYSVDELKTYHGKKFKQKRNEVNALRAAYPEIEVKTLDIKDLSVRKEINCLFHRWTKIKITKGSAYEANENNALNNLLMLAETSDLILVGICLKSRMIAFIISEIMNSDYALGHFTKADSSIKGANAYLLQSLARLLFDRGIKYFNYEEDLGLKNLRIAKTRFRPIYFLKKYTLNLAPVKPQDRK